MLFSASVTTDKESDMVAETESLRRSAAPSPKPRFIMEYGGPVMDFTQARNDVMDRLDVARAAGDEDQARRLEEEAEVLWWKMCKAMKPDREVPELILARFDNYPDHPRLPADARRAIAACRTVAPDPFSSG